MSWVVILHLMQSLKGAVDSLQHSFADDKIVLIGDEGAIYRKLEEMRLNHPCLRLYIPHRLLKWLIILQKHFPRKKFKHCCWFRIVEKEGQS
jgi:hypothetical protein